MENKKLYEIALTKIPGLGHVLTKNLISHFGTPESIFKAPKGKLLKCNGIGEKLASDILNKAFLNEAEKELSSIGKFGIQTTFYTHSGYPFNLRQIPDAPILLYHKGPLSLENRKTIAIVGTRKATDYGKEITKEIVTALKKHNPVIISGLAYGIDVESHKQACTLGMENIAVLAHGLDSIYPPAHKKQAEKILEHGALLSEYGVGTKPEIYHFPERNRIIAGLSDVILVVEAAKKGGALITAELANGYDREVFAVPGNLGRNYSEGCNELIRNNMAHIYTDVNDIEQLMNWDVQNIKKKKPDPDLEGEEKIVFDVLVKQSEGIALDQLSWQTQINLNKLASVLLSLEFKGLIKSLPGKKYKALA